METIKELEYDMGYYYCYSPNLKRWLNDNGLPYVVTGINQETNKRYWTYVKGRVLDILLSEYSQGKNKKE